MTKYESVLIARQDLGASQVNNLVSEMSNVIANQGGEGYYVLLNISAPATAIAEYERLLRVNEDVIRYMTVKVEDFSSEAANSDSSAENAVEE